MSTIESRWDADRRELERTTSARSLFGPAANYMSPSTAILLTTVHLATAIAVIVFAAPSLPATAGAVGSVLLHFAGTMVTHVSRQGVARAG
ncbi:MAG TPA: hypothetical protein VL049_30260 [Candidatus Dormibacteraeota bacterium]|nr:hypothetical protein [Candidatus Dormibacteraeota bacterium]